MAIIKCPECSQSVSDAANACPHCGYPIADMQSEVSQCEASSALQEEIIDNNGVNTQPDTEIKPKTGVHQKTWFVFVMLFVCFPVGCFLIWKYKKANLPVRIIVSIVCGWLFLIGVYVIAVQTNPVEHKWKAATCETPETCELCGETREEATGHQWKFTNCTTPMTCELCGQISAAEAGHKWKTVTCTAPQTCEVCGETWD